MRRDAPVFSCVKRTSDRQGEEFANFVVFGHLSSLIASLLSGTVRRVPCGDSQERAASGFSRLRAAHSKLRQFLRASFLPRSAARAPRGTSSATSPSLRQAVARVRAQSPHRAPAARKIAAKQAWPKNAFLHALRGFPGARAADDRWPDCAPK